MISVAIDLAGEKTSSQGSATDDNLVHSSLRLAFAICYFSSILWSRNYNRKFDHVHNLMFDVYVYMNKNMQI
jgi:hypothetical protein